MLLRKIKRFTGTKKSASFEIVLQYSFGSDSWGIPQWKDFPTDDEAEWEDDYQREFYNQALENEQNNSWR